MVEKKNSIDFLKVKNVFPIGDWIALQKVMCWEGSRFTFKLRVFNFHIFVRCNNRSIHTFLLCYSIPCYDVVEQNIFQFENANHHSYQVHTNNEVQTSSVSHVLSKLNSFDRLILYEQSIVGLDFDCIGLIKCNRNNIVISEI